jgi:two-component system chemotaxis response regulator CheY
MYYPDHLVLRINGGKNMNKKKVLVTDDSIVMRKMISDILTSDNFEIVGEASNGQEALRLYKELSPNLVTMDIVMPREHGLEALKKIIEYDSDARVIVISGLHQKSLLMEAMDSGARDYVIKPFDRDKLLKVANKEAK